MNPDIIEPLTLFVTDRPQFVEKYCSEPRTIGLCEEIFLEAESRPHTAERIAVVIMRHLFCKEKKYDGIIVSDSGERYAEYKVTCRRSDECGEFTSMSSIQINDVSAAIVQRYVEDQPLFVFPYFLDGHLAVVFSIDFYHLQEKYVKFINSKKTHGRSSFALAMSDWVEYANVDFAHKDSKIVDQLPMLFRSKISHATNFLSQPRRSNTMSNAFRFPANHKYARYGYDFDSDQVVSYANDPAGKLLKAGYSFKDSILNEILSIKDIRAEAEQLSGKTVKNTRKIVRAKQTRVSSIGSPNKGAGTFTVTVTKNFPKGTSIGEIMRQFKCNPEDISIQ